MICWLGLYFGTLGRFWCGLLDVAGCFSVCPLSEVLEEVEECLDLFLFMLFVCAFCSCCLSRPTMTRSSAFLRKCESNSFCN